MVVNLLLIPHQHRRCGCIDKDVDAGSRYSRHTKYLTVNRQLA